VERLSHITWGDDPVPPPPQDRVRPRQFRRSWLKFGRKNRDSVAATPHDSVRHSLEEPVQPARFRWNWPEFGRERYREGGEELIFPIDGIDCSGHLRPELHGLGGPDLAAAHSAADYAALLERLKEEVAAEKERRARHEARWAEIFEVPQLFPAV
jgi:hypothetical protein